MRKLFLRILILIVYCPDKYKALRLCDKAVDDSLAAFNLFPIDLLQVK